MSTACLPEWGEQRYKIPPRTVGTVKGSYTWVNLKGFNPREFSGGQSNLSSKKHGLQDRGMRSRERRIVSGQQETIPYSPSQGTGQWAVPDIPFRKDDILRTYESTQEKESPRSAI